MAYYSGTAASLSALKTALLTHAQSDGWTLTGDVLSKSGVYFQIQDNATNVTCLGCADNAVSAPAPNVVSIGRIFQKTGSPTREMSFPCNYEVFGFAQELYLVANYDVDSYQWLAFGKSTVLGLPGHGGWCGATIGAFQDSTQGDVVYISPTGGAASGYGFNMTCGALFWAAGSDAAADIVSRNCWTYHNLDGHGWTYYGLAANIPSGIKPLTPLISLQPNAWNSEVALLPLRSWKERPGYKNSMIADLQNARHVRIDNLSSGDILTIGSDKWKIFPWYRKNASARDGGTQINHTGTFGWAIRYEGP